MADNLLSSPNYINWSMLKFYGKPQMSTPDDPVIHSPPSIGAAPGMNGYHAAGLKVEEPSGACGSPDDGNLDSSSDESRRRQKTCRVCGDHATGYNFNVITCESCKAFFRRNALRPKEFKCPYSEDCEINSVSRRFCQKCRLRKCFSVGMKKEWILNEEQLRRRKNSRLNNTTSNKRPQQPSSQQHQQNSLGHPAVAVYQQQTRPLLIENQIHHMTPSRPNVMPPSLISPPGGQTYPLTSPVGSTSSDSPPSRNLTMMQHNGDKNHDGYDPNIMRITSLPSEENLLLSTSTVCSPTTNIRPKFDQNGKVVLSAEEYKQLLARIPGNQVHPGMMTDDEPISKRIAYGCNSHPMPPSNTTPPYNAQMAEMSLNRNNSAQYPTGNQPYFDIATFGMGMATATGGGDAAEEMFRRMNSFCDTIIQSALDSPENNTPNMAEGAQQHMPKSEIFDIEQQSHFPNSDTRLNYQLNAAELKALDVVNEAFGGMDDQMEQGRQLQSFLKPNKTPADIMNIMDVTMRRFVKVAKSVAAFREVSQEGKFSLLKGGMIEMLTIRGVTRYDAETNSFKTPTIKGVNVSVNVDDMFAKLNANAQAQKQKCLEFFRFFDQEIKSNEIAVHLVMLAVLFSVRNDPPMSENDVRIVERQHNHFMSLLNRYLESLYGEGARRVCERLPKALAMLNDIARNAGSLFMGTVRSGEAEELPKEFFKIE
ncbi:unnamed protein product [Caenorhabditis angaria]|uniref:Uncharacterized protein n=1 Tax=Caenorhabditis angaria TaxID=860376 RepID=A0A9P1N9P7_9PELO|nr:unnamed protein product [Caenorhabditis angaria]